MKLYLSVTSGIVAMLGVLGLVPAMFSVMMFDAPGATSNPATIALFIAVATFPCVCCAAVIAAWLVYTSPRPRLAAIVVLLPTLNVILAAIANWCLNLYYQGNFGG